MHDKTLFQHIMDLKEDDMYSVMKYYHHCKDDTSHYKHNYVNENYTFIIKYMIH